MVKLSPQTIEIIEKSLSHNNPIELKVEKDKVVVISIERKLKGKTPIIG